MMYDFAIIGAGPAGSTLARILGQHHKVLIIDKRGLSEPSDKSNRIKACGGLLAPDAQKMMGHLGLGLPEEVLVGPQLFVVRTIDMETRLERFYQRFYINMDREKFDRWLVSLIPESVDTHFNTSFVGFEKANDSINIYLRTNKRNTIEKSRYLIGADGAKSLVRKLLAKENKKIKKPDEYISIQEWFTLHHPQPYFSVIFDRAVTDFYSWIIPKDDTILIGSALKPGDAINKKFSLLKEKLNDYGYGIDKPIKKEGAFLLRPRRINQIFGGTENIFLIGEAAGLISPSSSEGFSYAFKSAAILGEIFNKDNNKYHKKYKRKLQPLKRNILIKNFKAPFMYNSILRRLIMISGLDHIEVNHSGD